MPFAVDLEASARLTAFVRSLVCVIPTVLLLAGCAGQPTTPFDTVPSPSATTAHLPGNSSPAVAPDSKSLKIDQTQTPKPRRGGNSSQTKLLVTPNPVLTGRVVSFNATGRFVVLNFPIGRLPMLEQHLNVLRQGIKVGEVKVTGPQRDDHIVADLTEGEARTGDEVRER